MHGDSEQELHVWTDADFENMSWHDCAIYGVALLPESFRFALDIDFITEWQCSTEREGGLFRVAPCTLVFEGASDLRVNLALGDSLWAQISDLRRSDARTATHGATDWLWRIDCQAAGEIVLRATAFRQLARRKPLLVAEQCLDADVRGGVSFDMSQMPQT